MIDAHASGKCPVRVTGRVRCQRTEQDLRVEEHLLCPYCFGQTANIETGEHTRFCGFEPERDPVSFGFPEHGSRYQRG